MGPAKRQIAAFLGQVKQACQRGSVIVTEKAAEEATEDLGWDEASILGELAALEASDFERVEKSTVNSADEIWTFCPYVDVLTEEDELENVKLWIRLVERNGVIVVSCHRA
jgi:hypothetical protein